MPLSKMFLFDKFAEAMDASVEQPNKLTQMEDLVCGVTRSDQFRGREPVRARLEFTCNADGYTISSAGTDKPIQIVGVVLNSIWAPKGTTDNVAEFEVSFKNGGMPEDMTTIVYHEASDEGYMVPMGPVTIHLSIGADWLLPVHVVYDDMLRRIDCDDIFKRHPQTYSRDTYAFWPRAPASAAVLGDFARFNPAYTGVITKVIREHANGWYRVPKDLAERVEKWTVAKRRSRPLGDLQVRVRKIDASGESPDEFAGLLDVLYFP